MIRALVYVAGFSLGKKFELSLINRLPFECGVSRVGQSAKPVSLRFFLLRVVFLIFDVELLLLYPVFLE